nr:MAG TPA: hypothetical protein [Caudoviricetes sp.]
MGSSYTRYFCDGDDHGRENYTTSSRQQEGTG